MSPSIITTLTQIWKKLRNKEYRDSYVAAHVSNTVASQISMLRERHGWTQKELAQKAGMSQSRISALEDPNYENIEVGTLKRLASAFDVALTVRFTPFSELATWTSELSEAKLLVADFANDSLPQAAKTAEIVISAAAFPTIDYNAPLDFGIGRGVFDLAPAYFNSGSAVILLSTEDHRISMEDHRKNARPSTPNAAAFERVVNG
jgi:transcriptional regulator with XRE-family HTH domain